MPSLAKSPLAPALLTQAGLIRPAARLLCTVACPPTRPERTVTPIRPGDAATT